MYSIILVWNRSSVSGATCHDRFSLGEQQTSPSWASRLLASCGEEGHSEEGDRVLLACLIVETERARERGEQ